MAIRPRRSLRRWLSWWLVLQTFAALGLVCIVVYGSVYLNLLARQETLLEQKKGVIVHLVDEFASFGDFSHLEHKLTDFFYGKSEFSLRLKINGKLMTYGEHEPALSPRDIKQTTFTLTMPQQPGVQMEAELMLDILPDIQQIGRATCRERVCQYE